MTAGPGAPYPHPNPVSGSNAIGSFVIGVSPIGTINPYDLWQSVISQYANSGALTQMITSFAAAMDLTEDFDNFYDFMLNVDTAEGYGLDCWGRIVNISRSISVPSGSVANLGFEEADDPSQVGFNQAPFYTGAGGALTTNITLQDPQYRLLILAKAAANICDGSIPATNAILLALFPNRGACYVVDGLNMTMEFYFGFSLSTIELAIVQYSGVLPTPCGVVSTVVQA